MVHSAQAAGCRHASMNPSECCPLSLSYTSAAFHTARVGTDLDASTAASRHLFRAQGIPGFWLAVYRAVLELWGLGYIGF